MEDIHDAAPLSIAYFSPGWPTDANSNGIVTYVDMIASGMRARGHRVSILANRVEGPGNADPRVYDLPKEFNPPLPLLRRSFERIANRVSPNKVGMWRMIRPVVHAMRRAVVEQGVQLLETEETFGWAMLVQKRLPVPVVMRLHGPWFLNGPACGAPQDAAFFRRVRHEGRAIATAAVITAPSQDVLDQTRAYYRLALPDAIAIPNPSPTAPPAERWRLEACEPGLILFVGRFDRHKGGDIMLETFSLLAATHPKAKLLFVGPDHGFVDDDGRSWKIDEFLQTKFPGLIDSGRLEYAGRRPNSELPALRRKAFVTVVASRYDNFPTTVMEAMSYGCPLVATRSGGIPEMVEDGVSGILCRPGDAADLADKIGLLLENPTLAARLGKRASQESEGKLSPMAVTGQMVEVYRRAIARHGGSRPS